MKKKHILDLLTEDYFKERKTKNDNFGNCISDFDDYIEKYIKPCLIMNQERFNYQFDLNSSDDNIKEWSNKFLNIMCFSFRDLISVSPNLYLSLLKEKDIEYACSGICFYVLISNITNIKRNVNIKLSK